MRRPSSSPGGGVECRVLWTFVSISRWRIEFSFPPCGTHRRDLSELTCRKAPMYRENGRRPFFWSCSRHALSMQEVSRLESDCSPDQNAQCDHGRTRQRRLRLALPRISATSTACHLRQAVSKRL
ncbi:hypothetical protein TOPH_05382 [Tolypocladium ophioglossoides CBS 100239]|uniref:Uncharacterized protein n=1 Tax=Tolypocladium ophioglossoides (strain CBS 100239) TaxID=1163406 RepID=A0A0L0N7B9_TOLOC|nr:hypothetical protein TOPH_05382 [Tolypocladium ophioglossoides CBS 100239]